MHDNEDPRLRSYEAMKIGEASIGVRAANHTLFMANVVLGTRCFKILWRRVEKIKIMRARRDGGEVLILYMFLLYRTVPY